jgi:hypothetical protein
MSVALRVAAKQKSPVQNFPEISPPRFVIGQDEEGHWVALDSEGRAGGLFASRDAALKYVAQETGGRRPVAACAKEPLSLWK